MNLNLVDLSRSIRAEYKGRFYDTINSTVNAGSGTNIGYKMLDWENKNMDNAEFIDRLRFILENKYVDFAGDLARDTGMNTDHIQNVLSGLLNTPTEFSKERGNVMRASFQIGDKIETNASGNSPNNYAGMLNSSGIIRELKAKVLDQQELLKEKDELIAAQRKTIELLENK